MDCTNAISMTVKNKGGRFTNITIGTGGADTHIEPEPSALLVRAARMVSREMGRFQPPHIGQGNEMINILIGALVTFVVVFLVVYLVNMLPIDGRAKQIVNAVVIVIGILSLLKLLIPLFPASP